MGEKSASMVFLVCALVGAEEEVFMVPIPFASLGGHLKLKIKEVKPNSISCNPDELRLFPAIKDGSWLSDDSELVQQLRRGELPAEVDEMIGREDLELKDSDVIRVWLDSLRMTAPTRLDIHILAEVPENSVMDGFPEFLAYIDYELNHDSALTRVEPPYSKRNLVRTYQCDEGNGKLRCMLLDESFPDELVLACQLVRENNEYNVDRKVCLGEFDDARNGLLLFAPLKLAFDHHQLALIYDESSDEFHLQICNASLMRRRLFDQLDKNQQSALLGGQYLPKRLRKRGPRLLTGTSFDLQTTFGNIDGQVLCFKFVERPYKRCLIFHAHLVLMKALKEKNWIKPDMSILQASWSEGISLGEKMRLYFASQGL